MTPDNPGVAIDEAHLRLIHGLVCSLKPTSILELGFGSGRSAQTILDAVAFNGAPTPEYVLVDSWRDWGGVRPPEAEAFVEAHPIIDFCECDEGRYVRLCNHEFDFILSDADHDNAHRWFEDVYDRLLLPGGIAVFHDVRSFPGLAEMESACVRENLRHVVFDRSTRPGEACHRGTLVVFKPAGE